MVVTNNPALLPRYHAREIAEERAEREGALLLLGSATPDVGSYKRAIEERKILELPERVFKQALPAVNIVDMRQEFTDGNQQHFFKCPSRRCSRASQCKRTSDTFDQSPRLCQSCFLPWMWLCRALQELQRVDGLSPESRDSPKAIWLAITVRIP